MYIKKLKDTKMKLNQINKQNKSLEVVMTRNMFKSALILGVLVLSLTGIAQAQFTGANASATLNASAEVFTILGMSQTTALNFGDILSTSAPVIDPITAASDQGVGLHASHAAYSVGKLAVTGTASKSVMLGWPASINLTSGANSMTLTLKVAGAITDDGVRGTTGAVYAGTSKTTALSGTGNLFLWVGGDLGSLSSQAAGVYNGTATFTVDYF
jgi:Mat/Ecp fimbriae major subunit